MEKFILLKIYVVILMISNGCTACFTHNETYDFGYMKSDTPFYIDCNCVDPKYTTKNLKWLDIKNEEIGPKGPGMSSKVYTVKSYGSLTVYIPSLSKALSGNYKCVTEEDNHQYAYTYKIDVYDPLYFFNTDETQYIIEGRNSLITCEARGQTPPLIIWYKNEEEVKKGEKYDIVSQGLIVKNVSSDDSGIYKCTAIVFATLEEVDRYVKVEMMKSPIITSLEANPAKTVIVGDSLTIECSADGFPLPRYFWNKTSETELSLDNVTWYQEVNRIEFTSIQPADRGTYECIVQNDAGVDIRQINIEVLTPPVITDFSNVTGLEGTITKIICLASGRPRPKISLFFESDEREEDNSITWSIRKLNETETEFVLNIEKLNRSHAGLYICNASNEVSNFFEESYLTVLYKPFFDQTFEMIWAWDEKDVNLSCEHDSLPPAAVEWRFQGSSNDIPNVYHEAVDAIMVTLNKKTDLYLHLNTSDKSQYGLYECNAKNYYGEAKKIFDVREGFRPPILKNVTLIDVKATSAIFSIEGPDAGPPVIGFTAEYDETEIYDVTNIHINRTWAIGREYRVDKLKPMTSYYISFAAINEVGTGIFQERITFDTPEKSTPEPLAVDIESNSNAMTADGNIVLKLKASEDNGDPIDYYAIKYCPVKNRDEDIEMSSCREDIVSPTTEVRLYSLDYNTTYVIDIIAHNSEGNSTPTRHFFHTLTPELEDEEILSGGAIIAVSIVVVILCIVIVDILLFVTKRQGMIANCCLKKNKQKENSVLPRDKKGLLKDNGESVADDTPKRPDNGHKEYEYNKTTGVITGKHSSV